MNRLRTLILAATALTVTAGPVALSQETSGLTFDDLKTYCPRLGLAELGEGAAVASAELAAASTVADVRRLCAVAAEEARLVTLRRLVLERAILAFAAADENRDGALGAEEVLKLPEPMRIAAVDTDNDGQVSLNDLERALERRMDREGPMLLATALREDMLWNRVATIGLISGASEQTAQPVEIIGREEIAARGSPTMEEVIRDLSEVGNVQGQAARGADAGAYGVSSLNLRNMGSGRTVLTINGRRIADDPNMNGGGVNVTGGAQQNANGVPQEVLAQIELLRDGGGAQFGAQAIAGVQNFVSAPQGRYSRPQDFQIPGSETYAGASPNPVKRVAREPVSTFSIDVDTAAYTNVRRFLREGRRPPVEAVRVEELINYFDYGYERPGSAEEPFQPFVAIAPSPWAQGKQLLHIGVQGYLPAEAERPPLNLVFLVDTSGSMAPADRLPLAQQTLNLIIDRLRPQDRVSLVAYAGSAGVVLSPTDGRNKLKIRVAIDALRSGGSTAGGAGLSLAYAMAQQNFDPRAVNRVILMTDGDFNVGVTDNKTLEQYVADKRGTGVYLSVYGFGRGNYQDARMQTLAQNGNGTAAYVDNLDEARRLFRDDFHGSVMPIADDVKIQVEFNPAAVAEYRLIGYETRLLRREDFNNDAVDAGEVGAGVSVTALYEITPVGGPVAFSPLRFGREQPRQAEPGAELAFLQIRYKLPGQPTSRLIQQPVTPAMAYRSISEAPEPLRWAAAVAAYGQMLRRDQNLSNTFGWEDTINLAQSARGTDEYGHRAEFIQLVRAARDLSRQNAGL